MLRPLKKVDDNRGDIMIPQLRQAMATLGTLKKMNSHQLENMAAVLLLQHFKHHIPEFNGKQAYLDALENKCDLASELKQASKFEAQLRFKKICREIS